MVEKPSHYQEEYDRKSQKILETGSGCSVLALIGVQVCLSLWLSR